MEMVGHKTESIYRRYTITDEAMLRDASARLAALHEAERAGNSQSTAKVRRVSGSEADRSPRARGTYNSSTGQIEWNDFDPPPTAKPTPDKKKKSWYWPF